MFCNGIQKSDPNVHSHKMPIKACPHSNWANKTCFKPHRNATRQMQTLGNIEVVVCQFQRVLLLAIMSKMNVSAVVETFVLFMTHRLHGYWDYRNTIADDLYIDSKSMTYHAVCGNFQPLTPDAQKSRAGSRQTKRVSNDHFRFHWPASDLCQKAFLTIRSCDGQTSQLVVSEWVIAPTKSINNSKSMMGFIRPEIDANGIPCWKWTLHNKDIPHIKVAIFSTLHKAMDTHSRQICHRMLRNRIKLYVPHLATTPVCRRAWMPSNYGVWNGAIVSQRKVQESFQKVANLKCGNVNSKCMCTRQAGIMHMTPLHLNFKTDTIVTQYKQRVGVNGPVGDRMRTVS